MAICPLCDRDEDFTTSEGSRKSPCSSKAVDSRCNACTELAELDAKIAHARQNLIGMQTQRVHILSTVNNTHDLLRRSFPVEILSNIFQQCLPDFETLKKSNDGMLASIPLRLSQVCRHWRTLSHSDPSLWNIMALYVKESQISSLQGICEVAQRWIERSGVLPWHVVLKVEPATTEWAQVTRSSTLRADTNCEQRLGYLHVEASESAIRRLQALSGDLPRLPVLPMYSSPSYLIYPSRDYTSAPGELFPPKVLRMKRILLKDIEIVVENITHVDISAICITDAISLLCNTPKLISCKLFRLDIELHSDGYPVPRLRSRLPFAQRTLEDLHITTNDVEGLALSLLFNSLDFPSLKSLAIGVIEFSEEGFWRASLDALNRHLRRSGSRLQSIVLHNITFATDNLGDHLWFTNIFEVLNATLESLDLSLTFTNHSEYKLASLIGPMLSHIPNLQSFRLRHVGQQQWIHVLKRLMLGSSTFSDGRRLSITIYGFDPLLDQQTGDIRPISLSFRNDECPRLTATDIRNLLDMIMTNSHVRIIQYSEDESILALLESDITDKVVIGLGRVLSKMQADSSSKRSRRRKG